MTNLVSQTVGGGPGKGAVQKQFVVNEPVYGQLLARTPEGKLSPVTLNKQEVAGKVRQLSEQFANEDPLERGGLIADALHQDLLQTAQIDLPVLKDPAAGRQFVNDLLNIEADVQQYGRPATGGVTTRSKDPLRNQRFAAEYIKNQNRYAESVPLTTRRTYGLGGINPMETEGGEFAAYAPRIEDVATAKVEKLLKSQGQLPKIQRLVESPIDPDKYFQYSLFTKKPKKETMITQLNFPSDVIPDTSAAAAAKVTSADIAANQLEQYMSKLQRGRVSPLTSEVRIQPSLF